MNGQPDPTEVSLSVEVLERIDLICLEFEAALKTGKGSRIEDYLGDKQGTERDELLRQLLLLDLDYRRLKADQPNLREYQTRFPDDGKLVAEMFGEFSLRADSSPPPGTKVRYFGDYELLEEVGHGGMGVVYKARQMSLNRIVALKMILPGQLTNDAAVRRFRAEAEAVANLQHPNIVAVHEAGVHDGQHYFAMGYVEGQSLAEMVRENPLPAKQAAEYVQKIAEAVHYAHQQGTLHRDLKPSNVLIDAHDEPRVTDFGLAKRLERDSGLTGTREILGTPSYMAPEQAEGKHERIGVASDVYSLGAVLYELLTGRAVFRAATPVETLRLVTDTQPVSPRLLNPKVPRDLQTISLKCLEKEPSKRYAAADELAGDLERFLGGKPIRARPIGLPARTWRWCRRKPLVAALEGTAVLLLIAVVVVGTVGYITTSRALQQVQHHLYIADMNQAEGAWASTRMDVMLDLLQRYAPGSGNENLRGFEWRYWSRLCHSSLLELNGHTGFVTSVAFSPDGKRLASGSVDGTVKVWDATSGQEVMTLQHTGEVQSVAFSPDGRRLASASNDRTVRVWDATTGQQVLNLKHTGRVLSVAFSPDGTRLASASHDRKVRVWGATSGQRVLTLKGHTSSVHSVAFSPDGRRLASASNDRTVRVWDATSGQEVMTLQHTGEVISVVFSPDGRQLASASMDRTVRVWDATSGQQVLTLKHTGLVLSVAFSPDGRRLASASAGRPVGVWDATTGQEVLTLKHHSVVLSVAFSPDGRRLASAGFTRTVRVWDATTGQGVLTLKGHTGEVTSVAFSPDGRRLASAGHDRTVRVWDATSGQEVLTLKHNGRVLSVAFSPDGTRLASAGEDRTVRVWDATTGQQVLALKHNHGVTSVAFSPDGRRLASASVDRTVRVWDTTTGQQTLTLIGHTGWVSSVAFAPDGRRLASASHDRTVRVWDATTGQKALTLPCNVGVNSAAFSPDGERLASASLDGTVNLWDAASGQEVLTLKGYTGSVQSVAFSPDGERLASASLEWDVKVWDATTGKRTLTLRGHAEPVASLAFDPQGNRLASASIDGTVKVWDARPLTPALRVERESLGVMRFLYDYKKLPKADALKRIRTDQTISEPVRQQALTFAERWRSNQN